MKEQGIMGVFITFITGLALLLLVNQTIYGLDRTSSTSFVQYVNAQIERSGNLNQQTLSNIEQHYSEGSYRFEYRIINHDPNKQVSFGEKYDYTIEFTYKPLFFEISDATSLYQGSAVSKVRGTSPARN